jgi:small-conductance mechanosensitive channel
MFGVLVSLADVEAIFRAWFENALRYLPQVALGLAVFVAFVLLASLARRSARDTMAKASGDRRAGNAVGTLVRYAVLFLGLIVALAVSGVDLSAMMVAVGAVGFALAFAMQETIANLIAGLLILLSSPFAREDVVEVNGAEGVVEEIKIRSTKLRTFDGLKVEVPNREVLANNITVFSEHPSRRFTVAVGIGYDDDIGGAVETARRAAAAVDEVLEDPPVDAFVTDLGGSSVNLNVRFWTERAGRGQMLAVRGRVTQAVKEALVDAGYDIPFPIRTLYLDDEGGEDEVEATPGQGPSA